MKAIEPKVDLMFKAFADETRLRILHLLTRGELCVCDITGTLGLPQSTVSRHLAYLRRAELVNVRKEGLWKHYSLAKPGARFHQTLLACLSDCFEEVGVLQKDMGALQRRQNAKCC